ncbi:TPA: hypothetical protein J1300_004110 [Escherichia coli]|nr:hypothetical protein [Escherichia coli]
MNTPVTKYSEEMNVIALYPRSFIYKKGQPLTALALRMIDILATRYIYKRNDEYAELTGYSLPSPPVIGEDEIHHIQAGYNEAVDLAEAYIQEKKNAVAQREKRIEELRSSPLKPVTVGGYHDRPDNIQEQIKDEENRLESDKKELDKAINLAGQVRILFDFREDNASGDINVVFDLSWHGFAPQISARIKCYSNIISAINKVTGLNNTHKHVIPWSPLNRKGYFIQEYINDEIDKLTAKYYHRDSEAIRNSVSLDEYTEMHLTGIKRDADTMYLCTHEVNHSLFGD